MTKTTYPQNPYPSFDEWQKEIHSRELPVEKLIGSVYVAIATLTAANKPVMAQMLTAAVERYREETRNQ